MRSAWLTGTCGLVTLVAAVVLMWHSAPTGAPSGTPHQTHTTSVVVQTTKH